MSSQHLQSHLRMLDEIKQIISEQFPIVSRNGRTLEATNIRWDRKGEEVMNNLREQKKAKLQERSVDSRLMADVTFKDEEGKTLDIKQNLVLLSVPHITHRNSYIVGGGNEVQMINQLRLRPGLYTTIKGEDEVETYLNTTAAGTYKILLDRRSGIIRFKIGSDKKVPVYSLLLALGASDQRAREVLGGLADVNVKAASLEKDTDKLLAALHPYAKTGSTLENQMTIKDFLASKPLDADVNQLTVGERIDKIDLQAVEAAVRKAVQVSKGLKEEDDTESLAFKSIHSIDDFIKERLVRDAPKRKRMIQYNMTRKDTIPAVLPMAMYNDSVQKFMTTSEFTRFSDQNNPIDMYAVASTTTILGPGGIGSERAVPDDVRAIHPSHFGVLDVLHSPEGQRVGITGHLSLGAKKVGNRLHVKVYDAKTGAPGEFSVEELMPKVVAFPDQYEKVSDGKPKLKKGVTRVKARHGTKMKEVLPSEVEYIFNDSVSFFSSSTAVVPFLNSNSANRVLMADKHIEQAVQLAEPDKPLVQHRIKGVDKGYLELFGENFLVKAPIAGVVQRVKKDAIVIRGKDGTDVEVFIHENYPLNSKTFLNDKPIVKKGDTVKKGQALVESNFTNNKTIALGKNLSVAMIPYQGYNFEDGTVISHKAAQKLASVHKEEYRVEKESNTVIGVNKYLAQFPQNLERFDPEYKKNYDASGVIKKGVKVKKDDILIPAFREVQMRKTGLTNLHKKILTATPSDISAVWDKDVEGEVVDVIIDRKFVKVIVKSVEPAVVGDKLSAFAGAKGIITKILGPDEVYKDAQGNEIDVLFNPFGSVGRINPGFLLEAGAGKVAQKTGKTFYVDNFNMTHDSNLKHVQDELKKAGISDAETITNPTTGHVIKDVLVGPIHTLKLKHKISGKFSARGAVGNPYTTLDQPKKESGESAQRISLPDTYTLLSGDAMHFLDDAYGVKGQKNDDYWIALQLGHTLPPPKTPYVEEKFIAMLLASGVNLKQDGDEISALPMTDKEVLRMSHGEVDNPGTLRAPSLKPQKQGLFDEAVTGGVGGNKFSHIALAEPIINPLMRPAVISVGNFRTGTELQQVLDGEKTVAEDGKILDNDTGEAGIEGVLLVLSNVDIDKEIAATNELAKRVKGTNLNKANRRLRYLNALKSMKLRPEEAYINKYLPVLPPKFRQITEMPDGSVSVADTNHFYREVILINNQLKDLKEVGYDKNTLKDLRNALTDSATALAGLKSSAAQVREYRGLIEEINGRRESKSGYFKSKVLSRPQDLSARTTVIPNPKLGLDDVGIPKKMALKIYSPFVTKRLVQNGMTPLKAKEAIKEENDKALAALEAEIQERPVLMSRAPSLHKFNMLGFKPKLIDGKAVEVNPLIVSGYNMDFDGDTAGIHVPVSEEARKEVMTKMLPSKNLISPRDEHVVHSPTKETVLGIYMLTTPKGDPVKVGSMDAAGKLLRQGKIKENTTLSIRGKTHCYGQKIFNDVFPTEIAPGLVQVDGKALDALLLDVAKTQKSTKARDILTRIKDLGNHYVTQLGYAVSLKDLEFDYKKRDEIIQRLDRKAKIVGFDKAVADASDELDALLAMATDNRFVEATFSSKATGKGGAVRQMVATPVAVTDSRGELIPFSIKKSYSEGHDLGSYLGATPGARQGLVDKGISVGATGYLAKLLARANVENKVTEDDCGTFEGVLMNIDDPDLAHRYGAEGSLRNVLLTPDAIRNARRGNKAFKEIKARSPLKCRTRDGICGKCAGVDERGRPYRKGYHLGVQAAQSIGERATQVTLQKFHTGGAAGGAQLGFDRIKQLFHLPENMRNRAVLAEEAGRVSAIDTSPTGGWFVTINGSKHFIPQELGVKVKVGSTVTAGQQISERGVLRPQDLLEATGNINLVQERLIDEMQAAYGKQKISRRVFETVVKPMTDKGKISDPGDADKLFSVYSGDILQVNKIEEYNTKLKSKGLRPIVFEPTLMGIQKIPHQTPDLLGRMAHERMKETLREAPTVGMGTNLRSGHPIAQLGLKNFSNVEEIKNAPRRY